MKGFLIESFFEQSAVVVAQELIGCLLCRKLGEKIFALPILETEAYLGNEDLASHARFGKTQRNAPMFGPAGRWYVYLCYGMHSMLNIVTSPKNKPSAVLIRAIAGSQGPGRLTRALSISRDFNNQLCHPQSDLWIAPATQTYTIITTPRIGIDYAGPIWREKPYRFVANVPSN